MAETSDRNLAFGYWGYPKEVVCAWGARFIWPDDMLWDRQGNFGDDAHLKELHTWLNAGTLNAARAKLRQDAYGHYGLTSDATKEVVLYEDDTGVILGNPNGSYGYLYVCAWLKSHVEEAAA